MSMKNDISFIIDLRLKLYEHQSTYNPNLPLRFLMYLSNLYSKITANKNLYGTKLVKIQAPQFVVFYNGVEKRPEREIMKLSDAYMTQEKDVALELIVEVININVGYNEDIKRACKTLNDYSIYVQRVRDYRTEGMSIEEAVDFTIEECIRDGVLREFLIKHKTEAREVSIFEYNQEEHRKKEQEEYYVAGQLLEFQNTVRKLLSKGMTKEDIAELLDKDIAEIDAVTME